MLPLIQMFDTFIATDVMLPEQQADLLSFEGVTFRISQAGFDASWVDVARHVTKKLHADGYTTVLSVLDDFFFFSVNAPMLSKIASQADTRGLKTVRLVKEKPRLGLVFSGTGSRHPDMDEVREIPADNPYKHSLSLSLWNIGYLMQLLARDISIWDFEIHRPSPDTALYYTPESPCRYNHIVEKGRYANFAHKLTGATSGVSTNRSVEGLTTRISKWFRSNVLFFFFGYLFANRRFRKIPSIDSH